MKLRYTVEPKAAIKSFTVTKRVNSLSSALALVIVIKNDKKDTVCNFKLYDDKDNFIQNL